VREFAFDLARVGGENPRQRTRIGGGVIVICICGKKREKNNTRF
jgi:hypothetical protein